MTFWLTPGTKGLILYVDKTVENLMMRVKLSALALSWRSSLSYGSQYIHFLCKSMGWFLYDRDLCHKRGNINVFWWWKYCAICSNTFISNAPLKLAKKWKLQGAKRLHFNWDFMNKIEVRSNTEFSQPYCACPQKRDFVGHQTGIKKTYNIKKEKRNLMHLCDREITAKLVFNILILDLNKKKKQI